MPPARAPIVGRPAIAASIGTRRAPRPTNGSTANRAAE